MHRITITFPENDFVQLQNIATKQWISLAQYIRDLVDIGYQVEAAITPQVSNDVNNNTVLHLGDAKELWKTSLLCVLESRYLIRYLVDNLTNQTAEEREVVINAVKEKSQSLVAELVDDSS